VTGDQELSTSSPEDSSGTGQRERSLRRRASKAGPGAACRKHLVPHPGSGWSPKQDYDLDRLAFTMWELAFPW